MAKAHSNYRLPAYLLFFITAFTNAQDSTTNANDSPTPVNTSPIRTEQNSAATRTDPATTDAAMHLWDIANSLLSVYYPSTTISNVADLTWPSEVVIGSSTYTNSNTRIEGTQSALVTSPSPSMSPSTSLSTLPTSSPPSSLSTVPISSLDVSRPATTGEGTASETEPSEEPQSSGMPRDRKLAIALGVVFGVLAVAVMLFALICIHRRQRRHGGTGIFPSRKRTASPTNSEVEEWRARHPHMNLITGAAAPMTQRENRPPRDWVDHYNRLPDQCTPPAHMHPAFMHQHTGSAGTLSETNPFFTPRDRAIQQDNNYSDYHPGYPKSGLNETISEYKPYKPDLKRSQSSHRRSSSSSHDINDRPPTPFSPMMMMQTSSPPQRNTYNANNPFTSSTADASSEDIAQRQHLTQRDYEHDANEETDLVSPMQPPSKSPARRYSPLVHYPSWSEISEFDFTGEAGAGERGGRERRSASFGVDGYGRDRESVVGRTELA